MAKLLAEDLSNKSYCWNTPVVTPSNSLCFTPEHEPKNLKNVQQIEIIEFTKDKPHADVVNQGIYAFRYLKILYTTNFFLVESVGNPCVSFPPFKLYVNVTGMPCKHEFFPYGINKMYPVYLFFP